MINKIQDDGLFWWIKANVIEKVYTEVLYYTDNVLSRRYTQGLILY